MHKQREEHYLLASNAFESSINLKKKIFENTKSLSTIVDISSEIINALKDDKKVLFCGNGGSAADAQHLAAELSGKFRLEREPLFAEALHVNTSYLTAVSNDYSFGEIFSRLVKAKGRRGDILIGISTSGNAKNVINAIDTANKLGVITVGLTGESGGNMADICKYLLKVPSADTPRIQEAHILIGHIICEIVEKGMFCDQ